MRSRLLWILPILLVPLAALGERGLRSRAAGEWAQGGDARWIWAAPQGLIQNASFFAVRDFELETFAGRARLICRANEAYLLYVNGSLVAVARHRDTDALDSYEIGHLLRPGANRVVAELRTSRSSGGFLLKLEVTGDERLTLGTDDSWRIVRRYSEELLLPGGATWETEAPEISPPPTEGRWRVPRSGPARLGFGDLVDLGASLHAPRAMSDRTGGRWRGLAPPDVSSPPLGHVVTFDWGREVVGYANVVFGRKEGAIALVFAGRQRPDPEVDRPVAHLVNPDGRKSWSDDRPRRFRYVTVVASAEMVGARVLPLQPEFAAEIVAASSRRGVLGLEALNLRAPLENEIRSELERLASVAAGQGV